MANWIRIETTTRTGASLASALMALTLAAATPTLALAQSASLQPTGCIHYSPSGNRFIDNSSRSKADIVDDLRNAAAQPSVFGAADACLAGMQRNLSAQAYQRLASQSPSTFAPLQEGRSSAVKTAPDGYIAAITQAPPFRFTFLDLDPYVPSGYVPALFIVAGVTDDNRVLGYVFADDGTFSNTSVAEYSNGFIKVLGQGVLLATSPSTGSMGGQANIDPSTFFGQAAIFRDNGVELVPRVTGEVNSQVRAINDLGVAIVQSFDENFNVTYSVYAAGQRRPLDLGVSQPVVTAINNRGTLVGIASIGGHSRAFSYNLVTGRTQIFEPLAGDSASWASDINDFEDISGFSFGAAAEHVGVFSIQTGRFDTYFTEGTPDVPTIGNVVNVSNARSPLVVTSFREGRSYVIPKKGARIPLSALVDGDPATQGSNYQVAGINNFNAMVGNTDLVGAFLIKSKIGR